MKLRQEKLDRARFCQSCLLHSK